jgi:hypothetical protein
MEYSLKGRVFEGGTVYIAGYPVIVETLENPGH